MCYCGDCFYVCVRSLASLLYLLSDPSTPPSLPGACVPSSFQQLALSLPLTPTTILIMMSPKQPQPLNLCTPSRSMSAGMSNEVRRVPANTRLLISGILTFYTQNTGHILHILSKCVPGIWLPSTPRDSN